MGFQEISSLDAENTIAIGKKDKKTGKAYPKQAEGYYLGSRQVQNKRGVSTLHFLQTPDGNLGVWGTTDLNRKLGGVIPGEMVRITSTGTKLTPNGEMYTYKVERDQSETIDVSGIAQANAGGGFNEESSEDLGDEDDNEEEYVAPVATKSSADRAAQVSALLKGKKVN